MFVLNNMEIICSKCGEPCEPVRIDDSFPFEHGSVSGIHRGSSDGDLASNCCEAEFVDHDDVVEYLKD